jgi:hypothetical protein
VLLPALLERFAARRLRGEGGAALAETFVRVTGRPFAPAFHRFAVAAAGEYAVTPVRSLARKQHYRGFVPPLAVHYVRLRREPCTVSVTLSRGAGDGRCDARLRMGKRHPGLPERDAAARRTRFERWQEPDVHDSDLARALAALPRAAADRVERRCRRPRRLQRRSSLSAGATAARSSLDSAGNVGPTSTKGPQIKPVTSP